jgi:gluconate 5-dehydrogenase
MNVKKLFDLSGKTALITGGSRGLGLQIVEGAPDSLAVRPFAGRGA